MPDAFTGAVWMSRVSPRHQHASPNQSYGTPLRSASPKRLLSAMRLPLGSGYGRVSAGRWALTPLATRNSAATSRVAASAPSGNT